MVSAAIWRAFQPAAPRPSPGPQPREPFAELEGLPDIGPGGGLGHPQGGGELGDRELLDREHTLTQRAGAGLRGPATGPSPGRASPAHARGRPHRRSVGHPVQVGPVGHRPQLPGSGLRPGGAARRRRRQRRAGSRPSTSTDRPATTAPAAPAPPAPPELRPGWCGGGVRHATGSRRAPPTVSVAGTRFPQAWLGKVRLGGSKVWRGSTAQGAGSTASRTGAT